MEILLLGATGLIGSAILDELIAHGHDVSALARSGTAAAKITGKGCIPVHGDLRHPDIWINIIHDIDAVIHAAATFEDDMGAVDRGIVDAVIRETQSRPTPLPFVYTGGCWLYGDTGGIAVDETAPFSPISAFAWMVENARLLEDAPNISTRIVHPAMVYERDGGAVARFLDAVEDGKPSEIWGSTDVHWPMVERRDLAIAYRLVLEKGQENRHYNVATNEKVRVDALADAIHGRFGLSTPPIIRERNEVVQEFGDWAIGPTLNQGMDAARIRNELGWQPHIRDVISEIS